VLSKKPEIREISTSTDDIIKDTAPPKVSIKSIII